MASGWIRVVGVLCSVLTIVNSLQIVTEPLHTGTRLSSVTLKCSYQVPASNNKRVLKTWRMVSDVSGEEEIVFSETDLDGGTGYGRYLDRVNIVGGEADINIVRLEVADTGDYTCEIDYYVEGDAGSGETRLEVYNLVNTVDILQFSPGADLVVREGQEIQLVCKATLGAPAAKLIWYIGDEELGQGEETITENSDGTFNTQSDYVYVGSADHHLKSLKCQSDQDPQLEGQYRNDHIRIISSGVWTRASSLMILLSFLVYIGTSKLF